MELQVWGRHHNQIGEQMYYPPRWALKMSQKRTSEMGQLQLHPLLRSMVTTGRPVGAFVA